MTSNSILPPTDAQAPADTRRKLGRRIFAALLGMGAAQSREASNQYVWVRSWGSRYQPLARLRAKSSRHVARKSQSSNYSRLLANRLSGFLDSQKGCHATSQQRQFPISQASVSAPVTTGAAALLIHQQEPSSSSFTRKWGGSSSNISCVGAVSLGGSRSLKRAISSPLGKKPGATPGGNSASLIKEAA